MTRRVPNDFAHRTPPFLPIGRPKASNPPRAAFPATVGADSTLRLVDLLVGAERRIVQDTPQQTTPGRSSCSAGSAPDYLYRRTNHADVLDLYLIIGVPIGHSWTSAGRTIINDYTRVLRSSTERPFRALVDGRRRPMRTWLSRNVDQNASATYKEQSGPRARPSETEAAGHEDRQVAMSPTGTVNRPVIPTATVAAAMPTLPRMRDATGRRCPANVQSIAVIAAITAATAPARMSDSAPLKACFEAAVTIRSTPAPATTMPR